jgi:NADPH:quinone reductase
MRALVCHHLADDRSGLRFEPGWPEPQPPGAGEVTVAISHAALNFPDLLMLSGGYQFRPEVPFIPGTEACGSVVAAGYGAEAWQGQRVLVGGRGGCFAERLTLPVAAIRAVPADLADAQAAAFTVGALTAWVGLMTRGRLQPGERVLVTGAGGGMGLAAVALAVNEGAHVVAIASTNERLAAARAAGAHDTIRIERAAPTIDRCDIDVVFDPVGGALALPVIGSLARRGRYLVIGFVGGRPGPFALDRALLQEIEVIGVRAGEYARQDPAAGRRHIAAIDARAAVLRPHIGLSVELSKGAAAFAAMAAGDVLGKAVLRVNAARSG